MDIRIYKPQIDQIDELINLWREQYDYHNKLDNIYYINNSSDLDKKFRLLLEKAIRQNDPLILIAQVSSEIAGFVTYNIQRNEYIDSSIKEFGVVIELYVKDKYRKMGIGTTLMRNVEEYFKKKGLEYIEIQLSTFNFNAMNFYNQRDYINRQSFVFKKI